MHRRYYGICEGVDGLHPIAPCGPSDDLLQPPPATKAAQDLLTELMDVLFSIEDALDPSVSCRPSNDTPGDE